MNQSQEEDLVIYGHLICDKGDALENWGKDNLINKWTSANVSIWK